MYHVSHDVSLNSNLVKNLGSHGRRVSARRLPVGQTQVHDERNASTEARQCGIESPRRNNVKEVTKLRSVYPFAIRELI